MATWVTHMIVADKVLELFPQLDKRGFCVGNIAPDCNDFSEAGGDFIPPRKVTHWMTGERKKPSDTDIFYHEYFLKHSEDHNSREYYSFLLGYYAHLITDADFQWFTREEDRVRSAWDRIKADVRYKGKIDICEETWDTFKSIVTPREISRERDALEAEYLRNHPDYECSYFTEILPLTDFPDYIDYLPKGSIARKIPFMQYTPVYDPELDPVGFSREEFDFLLDYIVRDVAGRFEKYGLLEDKRLLS